MNKLVMNGRFKVGPVTAQGTSGCMGGDSLYLDITAMRQGQGLEEHRFKNVISPAEAIFEAFDDIRELQTNTTPSVGR